MRRRGAAFLVVSAACAAVLTTPTGAAPHLAVAQGAPRDLRALASAAWARFTGAFAARQDCLAPVTVRGAAGLPDRATYDPDRGLVTVRIPGTAANLEASLVHEFAHHLEFTCPAHRTLRPEFLAAQGLARTTPWFEAPEWEQIPSEQFAEAATEYVLGRRSAGARIAVTDEAVGAVRAWANEN